MLYTKEEIKEVLDSYPNFDEVATSLFEAIQHLQERKAALRAQKKLHSFKTTFLFVDEYESELNRVEKVRQILIKLVARLQQKFNEQEYVLDSVVLEGLTEERLSDICTFYNYPKSKIVRLLIKAKLVEVVEVSA